MGFSWFLLETRDSPKELPCFPTAHWRALGHLDLNSSWFDPATCRLGEDCDHGDIIAYPPNWDDDAGSYTFQIKPTPDHANIGQNLVFSG